MMTRTRQPACCSRLSAKLMMLQGELVQVARRAAHLAQKGRGVDALLAQIADTKATIASAEDRIVDHEAEHAADHALDGLPLDERIRNGL